jgi:hypothetical protein
MLTQEQVVQYVFDTQRIPGHCSTDILEDKITSSFEDGSVLSELIEELSPILDPKEDSEAQQADTVIITREQE